MSATKKMWQGRSSVAVEFLKKVLGVMVHPFKATIEYVTDGSLSDLLDRWLDNIFGFFLVIILVLCLLGAAVGGSVWIGFKVYNWVTIDEPATMSDIKDVSSNACIKPILNGKLQNNSEYLITNRDIKEAKIACKPTRGQISDKQREVLQ